VTGNGVDKRLYFEFATDPSVSGMSEVTAACFGVDQNADVADGVPERFKSSSFSFAQVRLDLGEGLLNQVQIRLKAAGTRCPFCFKNRTAIAWASLASGGTCRATAAAD